MFQVSSTAAALLCAAGLVVYRILRIGSREKYLPPGPPTVPLLGNLNIFPRFLAYRQLSSAYLGFRLLFLSIL